jgi:hypothetical protein
MQPISRTRRPFAALALAVTALAIAAPVAGAAHDEPDVPSQIAVEAGNKLFLEASADGVQIYTCSQTASGIQWGPATPRATLRDRNGKVIGTHFGGPTWQATDGSTFVGTRRSGVVVDPTAIPWLLLAKVSASAGPDGARLAATTFVQRTDTTGGLPPAPSECNALTVGTKAEIPYTANYSFWKATGG